MKRLAAIVLLFILVFNAFGYQVLLASLQRNNAQLLQKKLDINDFDVADLVSIKTKIQLPYYQNSESYERVYGTINIDGKDYEFVKRRIFNDTLELLCLPDKIKSALKNVGHDMAKTAADSHSGTSQKKGSGLIKLNLSEYLQLAPAELLPNEIKIYALSFHSSYIGLILEGHYSPQDRPPQTASFPI